MTSFKAYIQHFSYKAITTEDWKSFLYSYFDSEKEKLDQVDWNLWFNKPGLAPVKGKYDTSLQDVCTKVITSSWGQMRLLTWSYEHIDQKGVTSKYPSLVERKMAVW